MFKKKVYFFVLFVLLSLPFWLSSTLLQSSFIRLLSWFQRRIIRSTEQIFFRQNQFKPEYNKTIRKLRYILHDIFFSCCCSGWISFHSSQSFFFFFLHMFAWIWFSTYLHICFVLRCTVPYHHEKSMSKGENFSHKQYMNVHKQQIKWIKKNTNRTEKRRAPVHTPIVWTAPRLFWLLYWCICILQ